MKLFNSLILLSLISLLSACVTTPIGYGDPNAKTPAQGSAGGAAAINQASVLEYCERPVGTMAISEEAESAYYRYAERYGLDSPADTLRLFA